MRGAAAQVYMNEENVADIQAELEGPGASSDRSPPATAHAAPQHARAPARFGGGRAPTRCGP